jgi:hypothetical protein
MEQLEPTRAPSVVVQRELAMPTWGAMFTNLKAPMPLGRKVQRSLTNNGRRFARPACATATSASQGAEKSSLARVPSLVRDNIDRASRGLGQRHAVCPACKPQRCSLPRWRRHPFRSRGSH